MSPDRILPGSASSNNDDEEIHEVPDTSETAEQEQVLATGEGDATSSDQLDGRVDAEADEQRTAPPAQSENKAESAEEPREEELIEAIASTSVVHRNRWLRLYYGETRFDFVRRRRTWFTISAIVILAGVISLATRGLNLSIDFVGGTSWTIPASHTYTASEVQGAIGSKLSGETITFLGNTQTHSLTIQVEAKITKQQSNAEVLALQSSVADSLATLTHQSASNVSIESVGPSWGSQITHKAVVALIVFFILIAVYISIFFEWRMAFAAIVAVLHDILVTVGVYSLTGFQVTPDTVVAILTILGYSLYDTIVVFDRVRDNVKNLSMRDRLTYSDVVNASMNQTLARSINTSLVAIMPILAVLVLGAEILGASTLQYFGLALLVGLTTGAYSSIFIASPLVAMIKEREPRYRVIRERLESRGGARLLLSPSAIARGELTGDIDNASPPRRRSTTTPSASRASTASRTAGASKEPAVREAVGADDATPNRARPQPRSRPGTSRPAARSRRKGGRR